MKENNKKIDWIITIVPMVCVLALCGLFVILPEKSGNVLTDIRYFLGDTMGTYYIVMGLIFIGIAVMLAFSKYGNVVLGGKDEKPQYSFWAWGSMMFTCGLAADILFYSFSEWIMYASNPHIAEMGSIQEWSGVYPIYHWSFIPWSFYLVLAVAFGYMIHVKKNDKQRFSEACRPVLGKKTDGIIGRIIDLFAVFALLAGTATTFSVATPLISSIICELTGIEINRTYLTIIILIITCCIYTYSLLHGFKGISVLAKVCIFLFFGLLLIVLFVSGNGQYIIETGIESFGRVIQNFVGLSTYLDPNRTNNFPQDWTIYYWAYWMVWCIAAPFFIGKISKGRTIKQVITGGFIFGVGSTIVSFVVLGNYSLGMQVNGIKDFITPYNEGVDVYNIIVDIINTMPGSKLILIITLITMILFYSTSFDSIAYTAACYSYKSLNENEVPNKLIQFIWCILLIVLPIGLVFSDSSMGNLQSVSIVAAFPLGIIMLIIVYGLFKELKKAGN